MLSSKTFQNLRIVKLNAVIWLSKLGCHGKKKVARFGAQSLSSFEVIQLLSEGGLQTLPGLNRVKGVNKIEERMECHE